MTSTYIGSQCVQDVKRWDKSQKSTFLYPELTLLQLTMSQWVKLTYLITILPTTRSICERRSCLYVFSGTLWMSPLPIGGLLITEISGHLDYLENLFGLLDFKIYNGESLSKYGSGQCSCSTIEARDLTRVAEDVAPKKAKTLLIPHPCKEFHKQEMTTYQFVQ